MSPHLKHNIQPLKGLRE
jgi:dGTP triphosphohydrolase